MEAAINGSIPTGALPAHQKDLSGYNDNVFSGKQEQTIKVAEYIASKGFIPHDLVQNEVSWFYK